MWRSFFLAGGIFLILLGGQTLVLENVSLTKFKLPKSEGQSEGRFGGGAYGPDAYQGSPYAFAGYSNNPNGAQEEQAGRSRIVNMKDWMPWSLLAAGTIIVLYTYSLPGRRLYDRDD